MCNSRSILTVILAAAIVVTAGCNTFSARRQPKVPGSVVPPPPAPPPQNEQPARESKPPAPTPITEPPPDPAVGTEPSVITTAPQLIKESTSVDEPPPEADPIPRQRQAKQPAQTQIEAAPPPRAPAVVPQLTHLLTEEEEWSYNREIDAILVSVNETARVISQRNLSADQRIELDRIRSFLRQTIETRENDLVTARNLVRRAQVLAGDLERSSR